MTVANLAEFNRELKDFTVRVVPEKIHAFQRAVAFAVIEKVIFRTPVDTGRARANWIMQLGGIPTGLSESDDPTGEKAANAARSVALSAPPFSLMVFGNNLPYIDVIENGGFRPKDPINSPEANARRAAMRTGGQRKNAIARSGDPGAPAVKGGFSLQAPQGMVAISFKELIAAFSTKDAGERASGRPAGVAPNPNTAGRDERGRFIRRTP